MLPLMLSNKHFLDRPAGPGPCASACHCRYQPASTGIGTHRPDARSIVAGRRLPSLPAHACHEKIADGKSRSPSTVPATPARHRIASLSTTGFDATPLAIRAAASPF
jgi:hypothetical protein